MNNKKLQTEFKKSIGRFGGYEKKDADFVSNADSDDDRYDDSCGGRFRRDPGCGGSCS